MRRCRPRLFPAARRLPPHISVVQAGISVMPGWPEYAPDLRNQFRLNAGRIIEIADVRRLRPGPGKEACLAAGLRGWALASGMSSRGCVFLGFDAVTHPCPVTHRANSAYCRWRLISSSMPRNGRATASEKADLEERLQQTRRMETVGALASGIAHNFNNIIAAILGYVEMAELHVAQGSRHARHLGGDSPSRGARARCCRSALEIWQTAQRTRPPMNVRSLMAEIGVVSQSIPAARHRSCL